MSSNVPNQASERESVRGLDETTWNELREIAARYPQARSGLLPMLHLVQSVQGQVTPEGIEACAEILQINAAEVSGVATFYTMYKRRPNGDFHVGVCTNTLCAVMGGDLIFERLQEHLEVGNDETAEKRDGDAASVSLEHVECNAACDYAPVVMVNWEFMDNQTPESATQLVDDLRAGNEVHSTRGPRLCSWRAAERVLAGFPDDLADEGPGAGPASLAGLQIAREKNWTAPSRDAGNQSQTDQVAETKVEAVKDADTSRAESETLAETEPSEERASDRGVDTGKVETKPTDAGTAEEGKE